MSNRQLQNREIQLPSVIQNTSATLTTLAAAIGVPRTVFPADEEIEQAWLNLPRHLKKLPIEHRNENIARLCVATANGLFDASINYIWNQTISTLRNKVLVFGLSVIKQLLQRDYDEDKINELKDAELLDLCHSLSIISEEGFFLLDQCRDVRNNFSTAHPKVGNIDDSELINFISRCVKYALSDDESLVGINLNDFITTLKRQRFTTDQISEWVGRIGSTFEAQRNLIFTTLMGVYVDPASSEESRLNALKIAKELANALTARNISDFVNQYSDYKAKGIEQKATAARDWFEKVGLLSQLSTSEQHSIISTACQKLIGVHLAWDNFYNEPPFAERLHELSTQLAIPSSAQEEYVATVLTCASGNGYGISRDAADHYAKMIKNFSPKEVDYMFTVVDNKNYNLYNRVRHHASCKSRYLGLFKLIQEESVPSSRLHAYKKIIQVP